MHIPAPKMPLPGHAESYRPPKEYLLTEEEQKQWEVRLVWVYCGRAARVACLVGFRRVLGFAPIIVLLRRVGFFVVGASMRSLTGNFFWSFASVFFL